MPTSMCFCLRTVLKVSFEKKVYSAVIKVSNVVNRAIKFEQREGYTQLNLVTIKELNDSTPKTSMDSHYNNKHKLITTLHLPLIDLELTKKWTYHRVQYDIYGCACGDVTCTWHITVQLACPLLKQRMFSLIGEAIDILKLRVSGIRTVWNAKGVFRSRKSKRER